MACMSIGIIDGHNDLAWAIRETGSYDFDAYDVSTSQPRFHTDVPRLRAGGVRAQFWSVYVPSIPIEPPTPTTGDFFTDTCEQIDAVHTMIERWPEHFSLVTTADELDGVLASEGGPVGSLLGAEGGHSINGTLGALRILHRLGVRYMTLTHNENCGWADSATDEPRHGGLSDFGREVVGEMNRLGMMVDLSHTAASTMRDALAVSTAPVIYSHSSARAVHDHPRNAPDDMLEQMAAGGGVCMVTFVPKFLRPEGETATIEDVVRHVEHVRDVAGIDHIGLGGDYDGVDQLPVGLTDVSCYPALMDALRARGWSTADLEKLGWRNTARVFRAVQECASA